MVFTPATFTWSSPQWHSHGHYSNNTHMVITPTTLTRSSLKQHSHGHHPSNTHTVACPATLAWSSSQQHSHYLTSATLSWPSRLVYSETTFNDDRDDVFCQCAQNYYYVHTSTTLPPYICIHFLFIIYISLFFFFFFCVCSMLARWSSMLGKVICWLRFCSTLARWTAPCC